MLRLTAELVLEMLEGGELEGRRTGDSGGWRVPIHGDLGPAPLPL
jgi:hypothetical protein